MAVAPPGAEPQTAVVPGRTLKRLMNQPRKLEAASVATTTPANSGQSSRKAEKISGEMDAAIRQPTIACAAPNAGLGTRMVAPLVPAMIAASIGPMSSAAGMLASSSPPAKSNDTSSSAAH